MISFWYFKQRMLQRTGFFLPRPAVWVKNPIQGQHFRFMSVWFYGSSAKWMKSLFTFDVFSGSRQMGLVTVTSRHRLTPLETLRIERKTNLTVRKVSSLNGAACTRHTMRLQEIHTILKLISRYMMTSSNENIFRVIGHLCGEITGHRWIPRTKASFLWSPSE